MDKDLTVEFRLGGNSTDYRGSGWSDPESGGTWMLGQRSLMLLSRPKTRGNYRLELDVAPLTGPGHPSQRLSVGVNGTVLAEFVLLDDALEHCVLPWSVIGHESELKVVLSHPDAWRPSELTGGEGDQRELSMFLRSARVSWIEAAPANGLDAAVLVAEAPVRSVPAGSIPAAPRTATPKALTAPAPIPAALARATQIPAITPPPAASTPPPPGSPASPSAAPAPVQQDRLPWWKKLLS